MIADLFQDDGPGPDRDPEVEGGLPGAGERLRRVQGLHARHRQHRRQERLRPRPDVTPSAPAPRLHHLRRAGLRLPQRLPRRRELHRHRRLHPRALARRRRSLWAAFFNFVAAFVLGTHVAKTIGKGMIDLVGGDARRWSWPAWSGAIAWNLITWYYGLPGLLLARADRRLRRRGGGQGRHRAPILWSGWTKTLLFIVLAPTDRRASWASS